jgi:hypothetical protein
VFKKKEKKERTIDKLKTQKRMERKITRGRQSWRVRERKRERERERGELGKRP